MADPNALAKVGPDADLSGADLRGADLSGADLSGADLSGANLSKTNLSGANLHGADLSNADLRGANLDVNEVNIELNLLTGRASANFQGALVNKNTYFLGTDCDPKVYAIFGMSYVEE